ncbi:recombinase family protein, partial [Nocardia sp. NPDC004582]
ATARMGLEPHHHGGMNYTLAVTDLHRLAVALRPLVALGAQLHARGAGVRVLDAGIDTATVEGRAQLALLARLDDFQRGRVAAGTRAGLDTAKAQGRKGGRPAKLSPAQITHAQTLYDSGGHTVAEIADILGVGRATLYGHLDKSSVGKRPRARRRPAAPDTAAGSTTGTETPQTPTAAVEAAPAPAPTPFIPLPVVDPPAASAPAARRLPTPRGRLISRAEIERIERFQPRRSRQVTPCPTCNTRSGRDYDPRQLRDDLAWQWLEPDPETPGGLIIARHCARCQPADRHAIECAHPLCENGPILGGPVAAEALAGHGVPELVEHWLAQHGWHSGPEGLLCPEHTDDPAGSRP